METAAVIEKIKKNEVRLEMITEERLVIDDTLDLLQGCSDKAMKKKVAQAWQIYVGRCEEGAEGLTV